MRGLYYIMWAGLIGLGGYFAIGLLYIIANAAWLGVMYLFDLWP
jgi:hypothetical protein